MINLQHLPNYTLHSDNWKHSIDNFRPDNGVYYIINYLGAISIKTVEYKNRMKIARECIKRVCSESGITIISKEPADRDVLSSIGTKYFGCNKNLSVWLKISTDNISMLNIEKTKELHRYSLQDISCVCGGDEELLGYLSYVAKDQIIGIACFVFQSSNEQVKDIIMTIDQAFDLRSRENQRAILGSNIPDNTNGCQNSDVVTQPNQKEGEWNFRPIQEDVQIPSNIPKTNFFHGNWCPLGSTRKIFSTKKFSKKNYFFLHIADGIRTIRLKGEAKKIFQKFFKKYYLHIANKWTVI